MTKMTRMLIEALEPRAFLSGTPLTPYDPDSHPSHLMGPFVLVPASPPDPVPSIDPTSLLWNFGPAQLPPISEVTDPQGIVTYQLPLWSGLPTPKQIHQYGIGDCYLIAELQAMAQENPTKLMESFIDYHDGTYGVLMNNYPRGLFMVRVTNQFGGQQAIPQEALWGVVFEKAYAICRSGANTYYSLTGGGCGEIAWALHWYTDSVQTANTDPSELAQELQNDLLQSKTLTLETPAYISDGAPIIGNHAYSVILVSYSPGMGMSVRLRNPWGFDGTGSDDNYWDGEVTLSYEQVKANFWYFGVGFA